MEFNIKTGSKIKMKIISDDGDYRIYQDTSFYVKSNLDGIETVDRFFVKEHLKIFFWDIYHKVGFVDENLDIQPFKSLEEAQKFIELRKEVEKLKKDQSN